jgi:hypothetical protein
MGYLIFAVQRAELILASVILGLVTLCWLHSWLSRRIAHRQLLTLLAACGRQHEALRADNVALAATIAALGRDAQELAAQLTLENRFGRLGGATAPAGLATRLASQGATEDDLMSGCGMSRAEAELVRQLHRAPARPM